MEKSEHLFYDISASLLERHATAARVEYERAHDHQRVPGVEQKVPRVLEVAPEQVDVFVLARAGGPVRSTDAELR